MRPLTPAEITKLTHIQKMIQRNEDTGIIKRILSIVIMQNEKEMWLNILELAMTKSKDIENTYEAETKQSG